MKLIKWRVYPLTQLLLQHVNEYSVHSGWSCIGDNLSSGDSLSIVACRQLHDAIARHGLFDIIDILEQEGIPKDWGIMLLPLIQQEMGGEQ